jgi:hypothetical protein
MRRWQQSLTTEDIVAPEVPEISGTQEVNQEKTVIIIQDIHVSLLVFLASALVLYALKPAIVMRREKERPEESSRISFLSILVLSSLTSALYLGFIYKIISF